MRPELGSSPLAVGGLRGSNVAGSKMPFEALAFGEVAAGFNAVADWLFFGTGITARVKPDRQRKELRPAV